MIALTGVATVIEIGTKMITGVGELIRGVAQQEMMVIGLLAEGKGTAATRDLLHGGSSGFAAVTMIVIVTVHHEAEGMSHGTEAIDGAENKKRHFGAENEMGHFEIVVTVRDTAAGAETCVTGVLPMAVRLAMFVGSRTAAAAGSGMEEALSRQRRWKMERAKRHRQIEAENSHTWVHQSWMVSRERTSGIRGVLKSTCRGVVPKWLIETGGVFAFEARIVLLWTKPKTTWSNSSVRRKNLAVMLPSRCGR